jgi:SHS family lactate transporter-like MFS transporter
MGAEWPVGASLAMESWPARSRGFMGALLQGGFPIGFALASLAYGLLFDAIGWRGLLWVCILPALLCVFIRYFVREPDLWVENRKRQREQKQEVNAPLLELFRPALLNTTLIACWWTTSFLVVYYAVAYLFAAWMQTEFKLSPAVVAFPVLFFNLFNFGGCCFWGVLADWLGRRWTIFIQAAICCVLAPVYLLTNDLTWIFVGFIVQGAFGGSLPALSPVYLSERFPTEVRCTANGFCYHLGTVIAGVVPPIVSYLAIEQHTGFAIPLLVATWAGSVSVMAALLFSPETKGKVLASEVMTRERLEPAFLSAPSPSST